MATQAERRESTRTAIVDAAFALFEQTGSSGVPLETIAQAAGVTKGTVLYHYESRAGLLEAVAVRLFGEIESRITEEERPSQASLDQTSTDRVSAQRYLTALLLEQASPVGRVLFDIGDELLREGRLDSIDPYRYLCTKLDELSIAGQPIVVAGAVVQFGRQLAFGLAMPDEIDALVAALDL